MRHLIIGTGSIGRQHIANLQILDKQAEFIFLRQPAYQDDLSQSLGAVIVDDFTQALCHKPDLVIIANPSFDHARFILMAMKANLPLYIEKPISLKASDHDKICAFLADYHQPSIVGYQLRFLPALHKLQSLLNENTIGQLAHCHLMVGQFLPNWRKNQDYQASYSADEAKGGGVLFDLSHELDQARFLLGEAQIYHAVKSHYTPLNINAHALFQTHLGMMTGKNTSPISTMIHLDYIAQPAIRHYQFFGEKGRIDCDLIAKSLTLMQDEKSYIITNHADDFDVKIALKMAMKDLLEAIHSQTQTMNPLSEGLKTNALLIKLAAWDK